MSGHKHPVRRNQSFLAKIEQALIQWLLPHISEDVSSLDLTIFGLFGSFLAAGGLVGCSHSLAFLPAVVAGILMNWFGDSLDGSLARFRQEERPRFGFILDHTCDLFSQILIIVAFGFSPFLTLLSALAILICYLMFSAYTYIRAAAHHIHQMSYVGLGATEFRILMIFWAGLASMMGVSQPTVGTVTSIDIAILSMCALAIFGLAVKAVGDARVVATEENEALARLQQQGIADLEQVAAKAQSLVGNLGMSVSSDENVARGDMDHRV